MKVDLLIIGGGPAGLSAALFFSRLKRPTLVYDSGMYRNAGVQVAHTILGHEGVDPAEYRIKARQEVQDGYPWTAFRDTKVTSLTRVCDAESKRDVFKAVDAKGDEVWARKVVLATGIKDHLLPIPGIQEAWGKRLIHCIYCHGTETANQPFGLLLGSGAMNAMLVKMIFTMWRSLQHTKTYIFTNGVDYTTEEGLEKSGLGEWRGYIEANPYKYEIITSSITAITSHPTHLALSFPDRPDLSLPYMATFPERLSPNDDGAPLLTPDLLQAELSPMGGIQTALGLDPPKFPPRMGDDARTQVPGLFWAGNSGSPMANVNLAVQQGQTAGAYAGEELGSEDAEELLRGE